METDTTPEAVTHAVARWHGYARYMPESNAKALLIDACDLIDALAVDLARAIERAELAEQRLADLNARVNADADAARAKRDRFETHPTLRDWREGQAR